jgi:hypothetical protein
VVTEARGQLEGKHALIYKMDKLMPAFYAEMDIQPGSIHDQIIQDKIHDDAITRLVGGILLAVAAIALTAVSLGAATPAVVAAGASIGAAGLSTYMAYDEYKQYTQEHAIAEAGFADDPSVVWLVLAIVGAGVDMAAATKAVRALAPAAKALEAGGEVADFTKAVEALQKARQLDEKIAAAADKAAAARKAYAAAKGELSAALGKAYSFPGPFTDPDVYRALVKMAVAKIKEGGHSLAGFLAELKQARLAAKLGELTPEELAKLKEAWAQAETLARLVKDPALLENLLSNLGDATKLRNVLQLSEGALKNLTHGMSVAKIDELVTRLDKDIVEVIGKDLGGSEALRVIEALGDDVAKGLGAQLKGNGLKRLLDMAIFRFDPTLSSALAAGRGAAVRGLGTLADTPLADLPALLGSRGFVRVATERGMEIWTHADGSIVRIKTAAGAAGGRPVPHFVKEILKPGKTDWFVTRDIFAKVADNGSVIPKGTNMALDQLKQFFTAIVGRDPNATELDLLMRVWGTSGHIPLVP